MCLYDLLTLPCPNVATCDFDHEGDIAKYEVNRVQYNFVVCSLENIIA